MGGGDGLHNPFEISDLAKRMAGKFFTIFTQDDHDRRQRARDVALGSP
jgi:hypothetical protein